MKLKYFLAIGLASLCALVTEVAAQTKVTQLIIQNGNGTTKLSQLPGGFTIDKPVTLTEPGGNSVKLVVPAGGANNYEFLFPTESGTLLTSDANESNGDAIIAAINEGTSQILADRVVGGGGGGGTVTTNSSLVGVGDVGTPLGLNLNHSNTWLQDQLLPSSIAQGNNLLSAINTGDAGAINVARGGTGQSSFTNGQLLIGNTSGNTLTKATLTAGTGISITNGNGSITIAATGGSTTTVYGATTGNMSQSGTNYYLPYLARPGTSTTQEGFVAQQTGTISNFSIVLSNDPGDIGNSRQFIIRNVTAATTLSVTISGTNTTGNSGANTLAVTAGDVLRIEHVPNSTPDNAAATWAYDFAQ